MKEREYREHNKEPKDKMGQIDDILFTKFLSGKWRKILTQEKERKFYLSNILSSAILKAPIPSRLKGNAPYVKIPTVTFSVPLNYWREREHRGDASKILGEMWNNCTILLRSA